MRLNCGIGGVGLVALVLVLGSMLGVGACFVDWCGCGDVCSLVCSDVEIVLTSVCVTVLLALGFSYWCFVVVVVTVLGNAFILPIVCSVGLLDVLLVLGCCCFGSVISVVGGSLSLGRSDMSAISLWSRVALLVVGSVGVAV